MQKSLLTLLLSIFPMISWALVCSNTQITLNNSTRYELEVVRVSTDQSDINLIYSNRIKPGEVKIAHAWPTNGPGQTLRDQVAGEIEFDIWDGSTLIGNYKLKYSAEKKEDPDRDGMYYCYFSNEQDKNDAYVEGDVMNLSAKVPLTGKGRIVYVLVSNK